MKTRALFHAFALTACLLASPELVHARDNALDLARQINEALVSVAENASASVVVVRVAQKEPQEFRFQFDMDEDNPFHEYFRRFFEQEQERRRQRPQRTPREPQFNGQGSGVVVRQDGYIVTNGHVVEDAEKIRVRLKDGREFDATVRGVDPQSDIAVLKIDAAGLPVARLGDSSKARVGEYAIAIGAPFELDYSVTIGHVSAKGRSNIIPWFAGGGVMDQDFIQTDASINPGNSGGPLVNINGEVIGINTMIRGLNTGIGFALPSNLAREVADKIIAEGKFVRAWIGVGVSALTDYLDERPEFREFAKDVKSGVVIVSIQPGGPASKSELKPSDIVTAVEGRPVVNAVELRNAVRSKPIGKELTLDVVRDGKTLKIKVTSEAWPEESLLAANRAPQFAPRGVSQGLGLSVKPLTAELAEQLGIAAGAGVVVGAVERNSAAEEAGIKPGDVITEINRKPVKNPREFRDAVKNADLKKGVVVNFISGGVSRFEILKDKDE